MKASVNEDLARLISDDDLRSIVSVLSNAHQILTSTGAPMSAEDIIAYADKHAINLGTESKNRASVVRSRISCDIKKKGGTSKFVKTEPGKYIARIRRKRNASPKRSSTQKAYDAGYAAGVKYAYEQMRSVVG